MISRTKSAPILFALTAACGLVVLALLPSCSDCGGVATCLVSNCPTTLVTRDSRFELVAACEPCDSLAYEWVTNGSVRLVDPSADPDDALVSRLETIDNSVDIVITGRESFGMVTLRGVDGLDVTPNYTCAFEVR